MTRAKVFISYSRADEDFASDLCDRLRRDGIDCFLDSRDVRPGENFVMALDAAIAACNRLIMVITSAYLRSDWARAEWTAFFRKDPLNEQSRLIPLVREKCDLPALISPLQHLDMTTKQRYQDGYRTLRRILKPAVSYDIERWDEEIVTLFLRQDYDRAMKRLLDFVEEFATEHEDRNQIIAASTDLRRIEEASDRPLIEISRARRDAITSALNIKSRVIARLALDTTDGAGGSSAERS